MDLSDVRLPRLQTRDPETAELWDHGACSTVCQSARAERMSILQESTCPTAPLRRAGRPDGRRRRHRANEEQYQPLDDAGHRGLGRLLNRFVTVTVCNSQAARAAVLTDERPDPASVIVIENGVDLDRFASITPVSAEPASDRPKRVGMVANLRPVKGIDILIQAAARLIQSHPDVEFHVAGEGAGPGTRADDRRAGSARPVRAPR